jgi:hypothetical protein
LERRRLAGWPAGVLAGPISRKTGGEDAAETAAFRRPRQHLAQRRGEPPGDRRTIKPSS